MEFSVGRRRALCMVGSIQLNIVKGKTGNGPADLHLSK